MITLPGGSFASLSASSTRCLYGTVLPPRMPASAVILSFRRAASGRAAKRAAAEHDRMDRTDPDRGEHREYGLGDHGHVDQHTIAATHTLRLQNGREAIDLVGELAITVRLMRAGLGRDEDQRGLVAPCGEVPVDSVVAEVGATAHEPAGERRPIVVEDAFERCVPVDERGLLCPESLALVQRSAVGLGVCRQAVLLTRS